MGLILKVEPAAEPVLLNDAKQHCKAIDFADDDALITSLIKAVRRQAEHRTGRALVTQQWELTLDRFAARIMLPKPKLVSVQSVKYLDDNGALQELANTEYQVVASELVGYIQPAWGKSWPSCRVQPDSVVIAYTCGYGAVADVPDDIKTWIKIGVTTLYNQRDAIITGAAIAELPHDFFAALLDPHLVPGQ